MEILSSLREKIDKIDLNITMLLKERYKIVLEIGHLKHRNGLSIHDPQREKELLDKLLKQCDDLKNEKNYIEDIFKSIFEKSREIQRK
ncbi:chorismate mutase [Patescibacteria group bacterium]|nr:chorismate mutase [Patescibacteria group bacterium]